MKDKIENFKVDPMNVRKVGKEPDKGLVNSIKSEQRLLHPVIVRPSKDPNYKWSIIAGGRRYRAALEAGLEEIEYTVRDVDDRVAYGISLQENWRRKNLTTIEMAEGIEHMWELYKDDLSEKERYELVKNETGFSKRSIDTYRNIARLPDLLKPLLLKPKQRPVEWKRKLEKELGSTQMELLQKGKYILDTNVAEKIYKLDDRSDEEKLEAALVCLNLNQRKSKQFLDKIETYPMLSPREVYEQKVRRIPMPGRFYLSLGSDIVRGIDNACIDLDLDKKTLITKIIRDWLKEKNYYA